MFITLMDCLRREAVNVQYEWREVGGRCVRGSNPLKCNLVGYKLREWRFYIVRAHYEYR